MKVRDIMTEEPVTIHADATVREAAALLRTHDVGGLPVMDEEKLVGVITEADVLSLLKTGEISDDLWLPSPFELIEVPIREIINWEKTKSALSDIGTTPVRKVMSMPAVTIRPDAEIEEAAGLMLREGIARLPVVDEGRLIGIVARRDIVHGLGTSFEENKE